LHVFTTPVNKHSCEPKSVLDESPQKTETRVSSPQEEIQPTEVSTSTVSPTEIPPATNSYTAPTPQNPENPCDNVLYPQITGNECIFKVISDELDEGSQQLGLTETEVLESEAKIDSQNIGTGVTK
jgi:hypothetical protein